MTFVAENNGIITFVLHISGNSNTYATVSVNDIVLMNNASTNVYNTSIISGSLPVKKGDVVKYRGYGWMKQTTDYVFFVPYELF